MNSAESVITLSRKRKPTRVSDEILDCFTSTVPKEFFKLMCGKRLGFGVGREVYENRQDPTTVIKFELGSQSFQNVIEWEVWFTVKDSDYAHWFAPCVDISPCGVILIQKRTEPCRREDLPKRMPAFLTDLKAENFGLIDGKLVAHDYGYTNLYCNGINAKTHKADWYA